MHVGTAHILVHVTKPRLILKARSGFIHYDKTSFDQLTKSTILSTKYIVILAK